MILAAKALLDENPNVTDAQIVTHMNGNLCRCTGYLPILKAIRQAAHGVARAKVKELSEFKVVNHSVPRGDGLAKVTGSAVYTSDMVVEHMAWVKLLRSPFARARILSIDISAAKSERA